MASTRTPPKRSPAPAPRRGTGASKPPGRRPASPSAAIYRRRRLVVLTLLLLAALGVVFGVRALAGAFLTTEVAPRTLSAADVPRVVAEPTGPPTQEQLANPVDCRPGTVEVDIALPAATLPAGASSRMPVTVSNTGQVPCLLDLGTDTLLVAVTSGDDPVWSSRHCGIGETRRILLDVGATDRVSVTWPGSRSAAGCAEDQPVAKAGSYRVDVQLLAPGDAALLAQTDEAFAVS